MSSSDIIFDLVSVNDLEDAVRIEHEGFPPDEAASLETFRFRQANAGELFLGAYHRENRELVGYVCSTLSPSESLTHGSMSEHISNSTSVCIHAVCVAKSHQRKGIALALLREYLSRLEAARSTMQTPYERVLLITHEGMRPLYEKAGFEWLGKSDVVHGSKPWYEMRKSFAPTASAKVSVELPPAQATDANQQIPPGTWEALQRRSPNRPVSKLLSAFPGSITDVYEELEPGVLGNKFDLLCPRGECGSVILKRCVGQWVESASVQLEPVELPVNPLLPQLPTPPATTHWWLVAPSPMEFENIGFSRPVHPNASGKQLKLLICAECDLGPLGWCEEGGNEFWLACARVGYRQ